MHVISFMPLMHDCCHLMTPNNMFLPQDTSCVLLLKDVGGELKDVAKGTLIQPASRTMHNNPMDDDVMRVRLARVLPGCDDMDPPFNLREPTNTRPLQNATAGP